MMHPPLTLNVLSLRYSSWSIRALLPLFHAGADVVVKTIAVELGKTAPSAATSADDYVNQANQELSTRRALGSVTGLFPVLDVGGTLIHEALAINEWTAEQFPEATLWPEDALLRAQARALSAEMSAGFFNLRETMGCHVFARVPVFTPNGATLVEIQRIFALLGAALDRSGGPFLFGSFGIVDAMYFPVLTRFRTYGVALPNDLKGYEQQVYASDCVKRWHQLAAQAPALPAYDAHIRSLGGEIILPTSP